MMTAKEIDALVARVVAHIRPERVIVFGSYAKGTASDRSDLDLCVVVDTPLPPSRRADALRPLLAGYLVPIDIHIHTPEEMEECGKEEHSFLHSVLKSGNVVYAAT